MTHCRVRTATLMLKILNIGMLPTVKSLHSALFARSFRLC